MSQYLNIIARPSDIISIAARKARIARRGRRMARALAANVRREARTLGYSFGELQSTSGLPVTRLALLWFAGEGSATDLVIVQKALGASCPSIWTVR